MPYVRRNGTRLFYRSVGIGEPCLVMHGGLGLDHTCMSPFLDQLGDVFKLTYYDHRGNGRSSRDGAGTMTFADLVADADAIRQEVLGSQRVAIIASSYGGFVALQYALRFPEMVSRLVLVGTAATYSYFTEVRAAIEKRGGGKDQIDVLAQSPRAEDSWTEAKFRLLGPLYFHGANPDLTELVFGRTRWSGVAGKRSRELSAGYDIRDQLALIRAPTLIIVGKDDFITPLSQAQVLADSIPHSQLVVFDESGHFPYVEEPEAFGREVREWLHVTSVTSH